MRTILLFCLTHKESGKSLFVQKYPIELNKSPTERTIDFDSLIDTIRIFEPDFLRFMSVRHEFTIHMSNMFDSYTVDPAYTIETKKSIINVNWLNRIILEDNNLEILQMWKDEAVIKCRELVAQTDSALQISIIGVSPTIHCHIKDMNDANSFLIKVLDIPNINNDIKFAILKSLTDQTFMEKIKSENIQIINIDNITVVFTYLRK